jgi:hypothetical protein
VAADLFHALAPRVGREFASHCFSTTNLVVKKRAIDLSSSIGAVSGAIAPG